MLKRFFICNCASDFTATLDAIKKAREANTKDAEQTRTQGFSEERYRQRLQNISNAQNAARQFEQHCIPNKYILEHYEELAKRDMQPEDLEGFFSSEHIAAFTRKY
jgi:hypothetical protein